MASSIPSGIWAIWSATEPAPTRFSIASGRSPSSRFVGNHDRVCCGLSSSVGFNPIARAAANWTRKELTPDHLEWLRSVPQGPLHPEVAGVTCAHGSPLNEDQYILNMRDAWAPLQQMSTDITFIGHTHIQGGFAQKDHEWHEMRPRFRTRNDPESWTHLDSRRHPPPYQPRLRRAAA